jgi:filamentous hemagglutinin family protein
MFHQTLANGSCHPQQPRLRRRALVLAAASLFAGASQAQSVLPSGGSVVGGSAVATISTAGNAMSISQSAQNAIINWGSFSIGSSNSVRFNQPNATAIALNRVQGNNPSQILGSLSANGRVFIVNPNGVLFGSGASVSVGGLVASTLSISDADFNTGTQTGAFKFTGGAATGGTVVNQGSLSATGGGTIALLGTASNAAGGSITANGGTVALADADVVTVDFQGDGLTQLSLSGASLNQLLSVGNAGTLQADGGRVSLQAIGAPNAQQLVVNQTGVIRARSMQGSAGQIILDSGSDGTAEVSGTLDASAAAPGVAGGSIQISGERINLGRSPTTINAGGNGAANGSLQVLSDADLSVIPVSAFPAVGSFSYGGSNVADSAVASALDNNTNVTLSARGTTSTDSFNSFAGNVAFNNASIAKTSGGDASLQVEAARNISLTGSSISSGSGALKLGFDSNNTNSSVDRNGQADSGGSFLLSQSSLVSNGGDISVYGQNDAVNGRAGAATAAAGPGIGISASTISTCSTSACTAATGAISLRGAGATSVDANNNLTSSDGIAISGSQLKTGGGNITADGLGGIGANGLTITAAGATGSSLSSVTGTVSLSGQSQSQAAGDAATLTAAQTAGSGLGIAQSSVSTGGDVVLRGQGADLSASLSHLGTLSSQGPSNGVVLSGASIAAGSGRSISISATAGSAGQQGNSTGVTAVPSYALEQIAARAPGGGLSASGGSVTINGAGGDVVLSQGVDVSSGSGAGGTVSIAAQDIALVGARVNAAGAGGGGKVGIQATQSAVVDGTSSVDASATASGNGGQISVGGSSTRVYGALSARGGSAGGNGGRIETSGSGGLDTSGAAIDASAAKGQSGAWVIDPYDVNITHSSATGTIPAGGIFTPVANTSLQDSDIGRALSNGTSVQITTGSAGSGSAGAGAITLEQGVDIEKTGGAAASLRFDAATSINGTGFTIASSSGALSVDFDASALAAGNGGIQLTSGQILSNGGGVRLFGQGDPAAGFAGGPTQGVALGSMNIDTRAGQSNAGAGGNIVINGSAQNVQSAYGGEVIGVQIAGSSLSAGTGSISIAGRSSAGDGLVLSNAGQTVTPTTIATTSGAITLDGEGSGTTSQAAVGVLVGNSAVTTQSGALTVNGRGLGAPGTINDGIEIAAGGSLGSTASPAAMQLNGMSSGGGAGIAVDAGAVVNAGSSPLLLRASNDGSSEVVRIVGTVSGSGIVDLRPGTVDIGFNGSDLVNQSIAIGSGANFNISPASLAQIGTGTLVLGSNAQVGSITVGSAVTLNGDFTLQSNGGAITLAAPLAIGDHTLALLAGGDISQGGTAAITAHSLVAISSGGNVLLSAPGNLIQPDTLAGSAAGNFTFVNANAVGIGSVNAIGSDAASYGPAASSVNGLGAGGNLVVQALQGNLTLNEAIRGASIDLVDAGVFLNPGANAIVSSGGWRVWSNTFSGESRGGLGGTGAAPNIYGCAYGQACTVNVSATDDHFIYLTQPTLTVVLGSASRPVLTGNPPLTYTLSGLVNGDSAANALSGSPSTSAGLFSAPGAYVIGGSFASPANYKLNILNGTLTISSGFVANTPDIERSLLDSYVYDINLGITPICPIEAQVLGVESGRGDSLTRQWFLVHARPRLSSCVQTEKTNSCSADF